MIEKGEFSVCKDGVLVATLGPGRSFGEIALMYECPRTATVQVLVTIWNQKYNIVKSEEKGTLWVMNRTTFRQLLMGVSINRRRTYMAFLHSVPLLGWKFCLGFLTVQGSLDESERGMIADALESFTYAPGGIILKEGDIGDRFFIVEHVTSILIKE